MNESQRLLSISDAASVHEVLVASADPTIGLPAWQLEQIEANLQSGGCVGAFVADQLVAFVLIQETPGVCEILHLATHPSARRQGAMARLLKFLIGSVAQTNEIWLEVHEANNSARLLYEKLGFREVGRRPRYYSDRGAAVLYNLG